MNITLCPVILCIEKKKGRLLKEKNKENFERKKRSKLSNFSFQMNIPYSMVGVVAAGVEVWVWEDLIAGSSSSSSPDVKFPTEKQIQHLPT